MAALKSGFTSGPGGSDPPAQPLPIAAVVLLYAAFGGLWIVLSDLLVDWLCSCSSAFLLVSTLKGVLFIAVTSVLLYALLRRWYPDARSGANYRALGKSAVLALLLIGAAILMTTTVAVVGDLSQQQDTEIARLQAIADVKSTLIAGWLGERERELRLIQTSTSLRDDCREWRRTAAVDRFQRITHRIEDVQRELGYEEVQLWNAHGTRLWSMPAGAVHDLSWTIVAGLLAVLVAGSAAVMLSQRHQLLLAKRLSAAQAEELRALQLLDAIAESSPDAIFAKDQQGRYLLFNRAAARFVGKPAEEVIGHDDAALFPPEQAAAIIAHDQLAMRENQVVTVEEELDTTAGIVVFQATKGPLRNAEGEVVGLYGISRDISDLRRVEKTAQLWIQAFERGEFALALVDSATNRFIDVNPAFARERSYSREELLGQPLLMVYPPELRQDVIARISELDSVGHGVFESMHQTRDGYRFPVLMDITVIRSPDGRSTRRVAYALDISERKRADIQLSEQLDELRRWYAVTQDREGRVLELKREINALLIETGRPPRYRSAEGEKPPKDF